MSVCGVDINRFDSLNYNEIAIIKREEKRASEKLTKSSPASKTVLVIIIVVPFRSPYSTMYTVIFVVSFVYLLRSLLLLSFAVDAIAMTNCWRESIVTDCFKNLNQKLTVHRSICVSLAISRLYVPVSLSVFLSLSRLLDIYNLHKLIVRVHTT